MKILFGETSKAQNTRPYGRAMAVFHELSPLRHMGSALYLQNNMDVGQIDRFRFQL